MPQQEKEFTQQAELIPIRGPDGSIQIYEFQETRELVALVNEAAKLIESKGESGFDQFRTTDKWREKEKYIFVLDPEGNMLVHPDLALANRNTISLRDVNGRAIIRGLIDAATAVPSKTYGWYHYLWPKPDEILPRWKSSYVRLIKTTAGRRYIVGSGMYNNRMEKSFVIDMVKDAVNVIQEKGKMAFPLFRDKSGRFMAKDAYIFVVDPHGTELVSPPHPNLEGRNLLDVKDINGMYMSREMLKVAQTRRQHSNSEIDLCNEGQPWRSMVDGRLWGLSL